MNKRKKIFFILLVASCIGVYSYHKKQHVDNILTNVEALASGEGGFGGSCYYSGSVDCGGVKVYYGGPLR